jgi:glycosyltransferase involved in cell wall biosynthesis
MVSSLVDRLVCVSDDGRAAAHEEGWSSRRTVTIHNGIDLARFAPRGPVAGGPVIVVARLRPEKAIDRLIDAVALIRRVDPGFRLEIAGDGELDSALREQVERLGLGEAVAFLGDVRDVPERLARASALVLPSHTEGISLTLLEAMATGLPVVATRVGGNPEVVVDGETGLLVPPADPPALAEALLRLRRDPELGRAMGARGRERVEQRFDIRRMVADYESTYVDFLERRRAGSARVSPAPKPVSITDSG